ncbi:nucleotide exchange factor GrpE [Methanolapillus ohkumae]|uniref:Protein GrpE n=1 Tax=Methanolapillus ohkumae TaxID=3028298 RepID=A0AA96V5D9_9EURY|nr:Protein GrpE [Methanosarcinaceae archaeon Am2]
MAEEKKDDKCFSDSPADVDQNTDDAEEKTSDRGCGCGQNGGNGGGHHDHPKKCHKSGKTGKSDPKNLEEIESLNAENAALTQRVEELTNKYLLMAADFDNYRKRNAKQMEETRKFAMEPLIMDMIEVADNFERAVLSTSKTEKNTSGALMEGLKNIHRQFMSILESYGVAQIQAAPGTEFDPALHESVTQVETCDYPDGAIVCVFSPGYTLHSKVIRPATVSVATNG